MPSRPSRQGDNPLQKNKRPCHAQAEEISSGDADRDRHGSDLILPNLSARWQPAARAPRRAAAARYCCSALSASAPTPARSTEPPPSAPAATGNRADRCSNRGRVRGCGAVRIETPDLADTSALAPAKDTPIVVYCRSGRRSSAAGRSRGARLQPRRQRRRLRNARPGVQSRLILLSRRTSAYLRQTTDKGTSAQRGALKNVVFAAFMHLPEDWMNWDALLSETFWINGHRAGHHHRQLSGPAHHSRHRDPTPEQAGDRRRPSFSASQLNCFRAPATC